MYVDENYVLLKSAEISLFFPAYNFIFYFQIFETSSDTWNTFRSFEFGKPVLTISEPELLRDILVKDFPVFNYRRVSYQKMNILIIRESIFKSTDN